MISLLMGLAALICDILSLFPQIGVPYLSLIGFVLAIVAVATGSKIIKIDPKDKNARAGKAIGVICIVLAVLAVLFGLVL
ncbi:MAG: hypothetical protein RRZ42_08250, partial [Oscillospiraceae bacterium]